MEAINFNFTSTTIAKTFPAACQVIQPHRYPQFRIVIEEENSKEIVFIFYKVNQPESEFFWYPLQERKELIANTLQSAGKST